MKRLVVFIVGFAAMITSAVADTRKPYSIPMPYAPLPEYPLEARAKHWTGSGLFTVSADGRLSQRRDDCPKHRAFYPRQSGRKGTLPLEISAWSPSRDDSGNIHNKGSSNLIRHRP
jgi:hypothetical protein